VADSSADTAFSRAFDWDATRRKPDDNTPIQAVSGIHHMVWGQPEADPHCGPLAKLKEFLGESGRDLCFVGFQ
jgi:hypothetical protein